MKIIILLGVHGAGKGEQMRLLLGRKFIEDHISTGEAYRNVHNPSSRYYEFRETFGKYVGVSEKGKYVPDEVTNQMVRKILKEEKEKGYQVIGMEGYPRTLVQAKAFLEMIKEIGDISVQFIFLDLGDKEAIERIIHRDTYDVHGESLEANKKRIALYHEVTDPMIAFLKEEGLVKNVDDVPPIEEVHQLVLKAIGALG